MRTFSRFFAFVVLMVGLPLLALADGGDDVDRQRKLLEKWKSDPQHYARLRQDLVRLQERSRALSAHWKHTQADAAAGAQALRAEMADLRRRNTAVLESDPARVLADPTLRAAEALVAAADAWDRERAASGRLSALRDDVERRKAVTEREEAARQARDYWVSAERLLGRRVP